MILKKSVRHAVVVRAVLVVVYGFRMLLLFSSFLFAAVNHLAMCVVCCVIFYYFVSSFHGCRSSRTRFGKSCPNIVENRVFRTTQYNGKQCHLVNHRKKSLQVKIHYE